jgi:hypothetical protein
MPNQPVPEESVEAVMRRRHGNLVALPSTEKSIRDSITRELEAAAPAICKQEREQAREALWDELEAMGYSSDGDIPGEELGLAFDRILERAALDALGESDGEE